MQNFAKLRLGALTSGMGIHCDGVADQQLHRTQLADTDSEVCCLCLFFASDGFNVARLLVVDDSAEFLRELVCHLSSQFAVVGELLNGTSVVTQAKELEPNVIVLDIGLPDINGFAVTKQLKKAGCAAKVLFLSNHEDPAMARAERKIKHPAVVAICESARRQLLVP